MTLGLVRVQPFTVAGLTVRTSNAREVRPSSAQIPDLWAQFYREGVAERVARAVSGTQPYGVYWDYESDASGEFNVTAGVALTTPRLLAGDITAVEVAGGDYLAFQATGSLPQVVVETWGRVWEHVSAPGSYQRTFTTDFEHYEWPDAVTIYIGVRSS